MLRLVILIALLVSQISIAKQSSPNWGYYLVPIKFYNWLEDKKGSEILEKKNGNYLVKLNENQVAAISKAVHENTGFCSGIVDLTHEVERNKVTPKYAFENFSSPPSHSFVKDPLKISFKQATAKVINITDSSRYDKFIRDYISFPDRFSRSENGKKAHLWLKEKAETWAKDHSREDIEVKEVVTGGSYTQNSIIIKISGQDKSLPGVVIGGHMDTLKNNKPGADDDASGAAAVAEAFRSILDSGIKFKRDIYFMYYAAEEVGLVGSGVVADQFQQAGVKLRGVLQFDMIGYRSNKDVQKMHFVEDNVSPELTQFTKELAIQYVGLKASEIGTTLCRYGCSDHASWDRKGYAAAFPFEASFNNMNHDIHTDRDTMGTVNIEHAMMYTKLGVAFVVEMAEPVGQ